MNLSYKVKSVNHVYRISSIISHTCLYVAPPPQFRFEPLLFQYSHVGGMSHSILSCILFSALEVKSVERCDLYSAKNMVLEAPLHGEKSSPLENSHKSEITEHCCNASK